MSERKTYKLQSPGSQAIKSTFWINCIRQWFPDLHHQTYFLPPLYFNRVGYIELSYENGEPLFIRKPVKDECSQPELPGHNRPKPVSLNIEGPRMRPNVENSTRFVSSQPTLGRSPPFKPPRRFNMAPPLKENTHFHEYHQQGSPFELLDADARDDAANCCILSCLQELASERKEVMVVISQLSFNKYLNKHEYIPSREVFPRPKNQGDFDLIIIHKKCGLITAEIKSVGSNLSQLGKSQEEEDLIITKVILKAVRQLKKSHEVLKHLVSDLCDVNISKTLMLPNLTLSQLSRVINRSPHVGEELRRCLETQIVEEALSLCFCSDVSYGITTSDRLMFSDTNKWWERLTAQKAPRLEISDDQYECLVARFCGPATTVDVHCIAQPRLEIRTQGEGVSEAGNRITQLCLYPEQLDILNRSERRVFLSGPPGTGKTILLKLQGSVWLKKGHDVHVVSTRRESIASSFLLEYQFKMTLRPLVEGRATSPKLYRHCFDFVNSSRDIDTAVRQLSTKANKKNLRIIADEIGYLVDKRFDRFCHEIVNRVPDVHIWAAGVYNDGVPSCLKEEQVTVALRSPPVVVREVNRSKFILHRIVPCYSINGIPAPTDGPAIRRLYHLNEKGHTDSKIVDCKKCGMDIAHFLRHLHVGEEDKGFTNMEPLYLKYSDVMVICGKTHDKQIKSGGLVQGMHEEKIPVFVLESNAHDSDIGEVALAINNVVTVAYWRHIHGLERKVVVVAGHWPDDYDRLLSPSRCTSQLIWIDYIPQKGTLV